MKTWMLIKSSIRKNRSSSIVLILMIMIATIFLNIGGNVILRINHFIDERSEEVNLPHYVACVQTKSEAESEKLLSETKGFQRLEKEPALQSGSGEVYNSKREEKSQIIGLILLNKDQNREVGKLKVLKEGKEWKENSVILPYSLYTSYDYQTGDEIELTFNGSTMNYEIYGFCEDIYYATVLNNSVYKCYISSERFNQITESARDLQIRVYNKVELKPKYDTGKYDDEYAQKCAASGNEDLVNGLSLDYTKMKTGATATLAIVMITLVVFAFLIIIISMVVIRFNIISNIEEDVRNIGSMEAIGFTGGMIRRALILQYVVITTVGFLLGNVSSMLMSGSISSFVAASIGFDWRQKIQVTTMLLTYFILLLMVLAIAAKVANRIKHVTPIMAMRNGIETFYFGKNHFPLDRTKGSLHLLMGMKGMLNNRRQNIAIGVMGILMSFSLLFGFGMYDSCVQDKTFMLNMAGMEKSNITVTYHGEDYKEVFRDIEMMEGIESTCHYEMQISALQSKQGSVSTLMKICDDYSKTKVNTVVEGRMPECDNEIALSYGVNKSLKTKLGDVVSIKTKDAAYEYVVVGFIQHISFLGQSAAITEAGMLRCNPSYQPASILLYKEKNANTLDLIENIKSQFPDKQFTIENMDEMFETTLSGLDETFTISCSAICLITLFITVLVLYYLGKIKILKEQVNMGIEKALGFTTKQLISHIIITFVPVITVSSLIGTLLGLIIINPILTAMFSIASIKECTINVSPVTIFAIAGIMTIAAAVIIVLVSLRIRRIDTKRLVEES